MSYKIIRTSTVALSLNILLRGQLNFLNRFFNLIAVSGRDSHLLIVEEREKVRTISIKMERNISIFRDFVSLIRLIQTFKKEKPEIVHSITPKAGLLSMTAAKIAGVPIRIHTFTGLIFPSKEGKMRKLLIMMDKMTCWAATNVYPEGDGVKNDLQKFKITLKPLNVLANGNINGINMLYFSSVNVKNQTNILKSRYHLISKDFVFVFVGRLVTDKGINELIEAFTRMVKSSVNLKLLLVGPFETELDPLFPATLDNIKNNKNIISVGFQEDVRPFFAIADALVFPSYREGFPNVVMQAGAMDLPAIVTDINGCNEIIVDGENGLIVPPKSVDALVSAMEKLISDKVLYQKLKSNARRMIQERYEQQVVWDAILNEYNRLLKEKGLT